MAIQHERIAVPERGGRWSSEAEMVQAARVGDRAALEELVTLYKQPLFALCYGILGHVEDAEDAVQETFLRVFRSLPGFRGDASFRTWASRVAVNLCLDRKRSRRSFEPWDPEHPGSALSTSSPESMALDHLQALHALQSLLPRHRALLLLKEREGWTVAEIAAALRCSPIRVKNELSQARRFLVEWRRQQRAEGEER